MNKTTKHSLIVSILLIILLLSGCLQQQGKKETVTSEESDTDKIRIGYSMLNAENVFFKEFTNSLQKYADSMGIELLVHDSQSDVSRQINALETWIEEGIDVVICSPVDPVALQPMVDYCLEQGIPFINTDLECENKTSYIGVNQYQYGYTAGKTAAEWINEHVSADQTVQVAMITKPQSLSIIERANGIKEGLEENCTNVLVVSEYPVTKVSEVVVKAKQMLVDSPDLGCIVSVMDAGLLDVCELLETSGYDADSFCIVGMDATAEVLKKISEGGILYGTVDQNTDYFAKSCLELAVAAYNGEPVERVELTFTAVTLDNVEDFLK